ncbi:MAG: hypothetical protein Q8P65_00895 [bacterium]|nr:hypothetical protein [bacterium]
MEKIVFKIITSFLLFLLPSLLIFTQNTFAFNSDLPNNKFGIHLAVPDKEDLIKAVELVNSSGGKWGYVTLVIQENDRDKKKWQAVFDQLRKLNLIPIIRLATQPQGSNWEAPSVDDIGGWIDFLQSLNWVVKDRYIVLFNEPNHATEWGGNIDPEGYAKISFEFAKQLKEKDKDYFIMLAGFDASAPSSYPNFEDEAVFINKIFIEKPELFSENLITGLVSHSYPNPGFNGSPYNRGRGTISTYDWELSYLKSLGIQNDLPVFITETGWPRNKFNNSFTVGENLSISYQNLWNLDNRVRAVTPFILNYQTDPFLNFSWKIQNSSEYYDQFEIYKNINKVKGNPEQIITTSLNHQLPTELSVDSSYSFTINLQNKGQSILDIKDDYKLDIANNNKSIKKFSFSNLDEIIPNKNKEVNINIKTGSALGQDKLEIVLFRNNKKISSKKWNLTLIPLPKLQYKIDLFPKLSNSASNIEIQIFDKNEKLVFKKSKLTARNGKGILENIKNIYIGGKYRIVVIVPYYLPRQKHIVFNNENEKINFKFLIPLDYNLDGKFDINDFWSLLKKPGLLNLFF